MQIVDFCCLSPHGESGLKSVSIVYHHAGRGSLPAWGEWIEICPPPRFFLSSPSLPAWGEWIEIYSQYEQLTGGVSLSPHGESGLKYYIENWFPEISVSPRMGRVD